MTRLLQINCLLLLASAFGYAVFRMGVAAFDEFGSSLNGWASISMAFIGVAVFGGAALTGLIVTGRILVRGNWRERFGAILIGTVHFAVLLSTAYLMSSSFRHYVKLRAAQAGFASFYHEVGWNYIHGIGVERSMNDGLRWLKAAADSGDNNAMLEYSRLRGSDFRGVASDPFLGEEYHRKAAEAGNYTAQMEREAMAYRMKNTNPAQ